MFPLLNDLKFEKTGKVEWLGVKAKWAEAPASQPNRAIGVDPGRNFGVCLIQPTCVTVYSGAFPQQEKNERWRYGAWAIELLKQIVGFTWLDNWPGIVEGAAYNDKFGQVGLAEVRFGFAYGLEKIGAKAHIVPPATIRKAVLGNGRGPVPYYLWPNLNTNAVDSLITACYAIISTSS